MAASVDAQLTVTTLALLGFNTDEYQATYPGMVKELRPINVNSFEKENEHLLLCCLHFLLVRLDYEDFAYSIEFCWPYLSQKSKIEYKRAIYSSFGRLQDKGIANVFACETPEFWSLHLNARGGEVWTLLRLLTET